MIENAISPGRVPFQFKARIVIWLPFKSRCKSYLTFFKKRWHISKHKLQNQLVTLDKYVILVLTHCLHDRRLVAIDTVVEVAQEYQNIRQELRLVNHTRSNHR